MKAVSIEDHLELKRERDEAIRNIGREAKNFADKQMAVERRVHARHITRYTKEIVILKQFIEEFIEPQNRRLLSKIYEKYKL